MLSFMFDVLVIYVLALQEMLDDLISKGTTVKYFHHNLSGSLLTFVEFVKKYISYFFLPLVIALVPSGERVEFVGLCLAFLSLAIVFEVIASFLIKINFKIYMGFNFLPIRTALDIAYTFIRGILIRNSLLLIAFLLINRSTELKVTYVESINLFLPLFIAFFVFRFYSDIRLEYGYIEKNPFNSKFKWLRQGESTHGKHSSKKSLIPHYVYTSRSEDYYTFLHGIYNQYKISTQYKLDKRFGRKNFGTDKKKLSKYEVISPALIASANISEMFKDSPAKDMVSSPVPTNKAQSVNITQKVKEAVIKKQDENDELKLERGYRAF